jgi:hypothetical protein
VWPLAALLSIDERPAEDLPLDQSPPEVRVELPGVRTGLEDARIASQDLHAGVASSRLERRVDVLDAATAVGDDHGIGGRLDDVGEELDPLELPLDERLFFGFHETGGGSPWDGRQRRHTPCLRLVPQLGARAWKSNTEKDVGDALRIPLLNLSI